MQGADWKLEILCKGKMQLAADTAVPVDRGEGYKSRAGVHRHHFSPSEVVRMSHKMVCCTYHFFGQERIQVYDEV